MNNGFAKFLGKAFVIIYHTILLCIFGVCCWGLDKLFKFLGFQNNTLTNWVITYDEPIVLMSFTVLFVVTMFGEYMPKKPQRFEFLTNDEVKIIDGKPVCVSGKNKNEDIYQ
jgi:hypothetical protein